jgi:hypothetical protein
MTSPTPGRKRLSINRSLVCDVVYFARSMPAFPAEKDMDLAEVAAARRLSPDRISWAALYLKAYGIVAARHPQLQQAYIAYPWPHIQQYGHNVGVLAVAREYLGEDRLFWGNIWRPEELTLAQIQAEIDRYKLAPVEETFAGQIASSRRPWLLRRFLMWWGLNFLGKARADAYGTFAMSSMAGLGVLNRAHPQVLTTSLTYGPVSEEGRTLVTLLCDHRVFDGSLAARVLVELEEVFRTDIVSELRASDLAAPRVEREPATSAT